MLLYWKILMGGQMKFKDAQKLIGFKEEDLQLH